MPVTTQLPNGWTMDTVFIDLAILIGLVENQWPIAFVNAPSLCSIPALSSVLRDKRVKVVVLFDPDEHILPESKVHCVRFAITDGQSPFVKSEVENTKIKVLAALSAFWDDVSHEYAEIQNRSARKEAEPVLAPVSPQSPSDDPLTLTIIKPGLAVSEIVTPSLAPASVASVDEEPAVPFEETPTEFWGQAPIAAAVPAPVPVVHMLTVVDEKRRIVASNDAITIICPVTDGQIAGTRIMGEWRAYYIHNLVGILDPDTGRQTRANDLNAICARLTEILGVQVIVENTFQSAVRVDATSVPI
jgi:hypothetical protein